MTRSLLLLSVGAMLLSACRGADTHANDVAAESNVAAIDLKADEAAIRGQVDRWHELIKAKDAAGIAQLYVDDGAVMPPNAPIGKGRAAIQKAWAGMLAMPSFDLTILPEQIVVAASGDMALDRGTYRLAMAPGGNAMSDTGKYVVVWTKVDGTWKAAADIFNSDLPASS